MKISTCHYSGSFRCVRKTRNTSFISKFKEACQKFVWNKEMNNVTDD